MKTVIVFGLGILTLPIVLVGFLWQFTLDRFSDGQQLYNDFVEWLF